MQHHSYDIAIVGAGIVGLTLACALAERTQKNIAVIDTRSLHTKATSSTRYHHRVSAITLASQRIFANINLWETIATQHLSPFNKIEVWESRKNAKLEFSAAAINEQNLGFIVENNILQQVLYNKCLSYPQITFFAPLQLLTTDFQDDKVQLMAENLIIQAKLAVAADGAQSWLRQMAHIDIRQHDYQTQAIVTSVKTSKKHEHVARQIFLPEGPLAFLPLANESWCSIVWSQPNELAQTRMDLSAEEFAQVLSSAFSYHLGDVLEVEKRYTFPLFRQQATQYVKPRLALIGDAAHSIHPLAGQGVNMGLLDAASLLDVVLTAESAHHDFASQRYLQRYARWRKADNLLMDKTVDGLHKIFNTRQTWLMQARTMAFQALPTFGFILNWFTQQAVGNRDDLPSLARRI